MSSEKLPVFCYGTLRPGFGNYEWALSGKTTSEQTATLDGVTMYGGYGFPYLVLDDKRPLGATGTVMEIQPEIYEDVLSSLDSLEGYRGEDANNHYDRVIRNVKTLNGQKVRAYVYVASKYRASQIQESIAVIESGDWAKHMQGRRY